ncbi:alpha/beta hydrolase [Roseomonas sp. CCTCC AB2023176]|uniref:alpha/beta hydrolase n=1 Tax=Roseomonas sp. CCTCC AB2023176 TaxID=3342640 RepID=UPI0035DB4211
MSAAAGRGFLHLPASWGSAPPVLLVHGAYHGAGCWDGWRDALAARGVPAAALDLRGHGALASSGLDPQTGILDYAADVAAAVASLPRQPVLVGHSLGALVVLVAVATLGARVAGLVLVAPSPPGNLPGVGAVPAVPEGAPLPPPGRPTPSPAGWAA